MSHSLYLQRCIELARIPGAAVEPNPRVGAIIVHNHKILAEGYHEHFGGPHAEVNAIRAVQNPDLLKNATLYVSLEPCNHTGKTPPCTELILQHRIPRVVIGCLDPNPKMSGKSVAYLRANGVEVLLAGETPQNPSESPQNPQEPASTTHDPINPHTLTACKALNPHFHINQEHHRPYILLKWSQSADGFISGRDANGTAEPRAISSPETNRYLHWLRHEHHAIWIGKTTALIDNPALTTRHWPGRNPVRIVMDRELTLSRNLKIFQGGPTIIINAQLEKEEGNLRYFKTFETHNLPQLLATLYRDLKIGSILVEGGRNFLQQFLDAGLWDAIVRCISPIKLHTGTLAPTLPQQVKPIHSTTSGVDTLEHFTA
jgi:diaminohydroxyphosphoribosylaminopyrimidine deaminase / 5-amino-6-(5-phosphoribosylamino)uracil reductase